MTRPRVALITAASLLTTLPALHLLANGAGWLR